MPGEQRGALFKLAPTNPGFVVAEPLAELSTYLLLPSRHEERREQKTTHLLPLT